jgi:hypothetical protein
MIFEPKAPYILLKKDIDVDADYDKKESGLLLPKNKKSNENSRCIVIASSSDSRFKRKSIVLVKDLNANIEGLVSHEDQDLLIVNEDHILGQFLYFVKKRKIK